MLRVWTNKTITWSKTGQSGILKDSLQPVNNIDWPLIDCMLPFLFSSIHLSQYANRSLDHHFHWKLCKATLTGDHPGSIAGCRGASSSAWEYSLTLLHYLLYWRDTTREYRNLCRLFRLLFPWCSCSNMSVAMSLGPNTCPAYLCCSVRLGQVLFPT